jgi:hypothetical protein
MRSCDPTSGGDFGSDLLVGRFVATLLVMLINTGEEGVDLRDVDLDESPIFGRLRLRIGVAGVGVGGSWALERWGGVGIGGRLLSVEGRGEPPVAVEVAYVVTLNRDGG